MPPKAAPAILDGMPLGATQRIIPGVVELEKRPKSGWVLRTKEYDDARGKYPRQVDGDEGILQAFMEMEDGTPEAVQQFASRHGVLKLCQDHGYPLAQCPHRCPPQRVECVDHWWPYVRSVAAIYRLAVDLHSRPPMPGTNRDWETLNEWCGSPPGSLPLTPGGRRAVLSAAVAKWVKIGDLRPQFWWPDAERAPEIVLTGAFTLSAIARQVLSAAALPSRPRSGSFTVCSGCGKLYDYAARDPGRDGRPRDDRRRFCDTCRDNRVPQKLAQKAWKARTRVEAGTT